MTGPMGDFANQAVLDGDQQLETKQDPEGADQDTPMGKGELLDLARTDPAEAAKKLKKMWELQDPAAKRRKVIWDQHKLWLMGIRGVRARPVSTDISRWELYVPPGALDMPPVLDQTESLLDKLVSHVLADKAKPLVTPADDTPDERDGAQFSERWLEVTGGATGTNDDLQFRTQEKKAGIYGSGFLYHYVDSQGWTIDPKTQQRRDIKAVCKKGLPAFYVRPVPETGKDAKDADGLMVMDTTNVGDLKRRFPEIVDGEKAWTTEQWTRVVDWKPLASKWALPWYVNTRMNKGPEFKENGMPTDASPVVTLALYMKAGAEYEDGAYLLMAGGEELLYGEDWLDHSDADAPRPLPLPVVQIKQLTDDLADDFYGRGLIQLLGPIGEVRSSIVLAWLDYLDRFTHPHTFLPLGSVVQPDQLAARDGRGIFFNPQGQPVMEKVDAFPPDAKEFLDRAGMVEQDIIGLYGATGQAQGETSADQVALNQAAAAMNTTQISDNLADAIEESWRLSMALARAQIPEEQTLGYEDEDGAYREEAWRGLSFQTARQVTIKPGTFTGLSTQAREMRIANWQTAGWLTAAQAKDLVGSGMRAETGLEDDPFVRKVRRELRAWRKGPSPQWQQQAAPILDQNRKNQAIAQVSQQPPPQPMPLPPGPFVRVAADIEQDVAVIRHHEIRRELAASTYANMAPPWQQVLVAEYTAMKQAAGILTVAEQATSVAEQKKAEQNAAIQEKVAPIQAKGQMDERNAAAQAVAEIRAEQRKLAQEITLLREQSALKKGTPPAAQIEQDTLLRDTALFDASGPAAPFAANILPESMAGAATDQAPIVPAHGNPNPHEIKGGTTGPNPGPEIPGGGNAV